MAKFKIGDLVVGAAPEKAHIEATILVLPDTIDRMMLGKRLRAGWYLIGLEGDKKAVALEHQMKYPDNPITPAAINDYNKLINRMTEKV